MYNTLTIIALSVKVIIRWSTFDKSRVILVQAQSKKNTCTHQTMTSWLKKTVSKQGL